MKLRIGFVTNSSSSSFTIARSDLTDEQIEKIKNCFEAAKEVGMNDFAIRGILMKQILELEASHVWITET